MADVTDATFATDVVERSSTVPVVIDLWAEWCGPCQSLGPILEKVIGETQGLVELAKVDVDANPEVSAAFQVQSIPAVYAMVDGKVVDGFTGAQGEPQVVEFVQRLLDGSAAAAAGEADQGDPDAESGDSADESSAAEIVEPVVTQPMTAEPQISEPGMAPPAPATPAPSAAEADAIEAELVDLLTKVKGDDDVRERYIALLDQLGADDPRTNTYRRKLATALF